MHVDRPAAHGIRGAVVAVVAAVIISLVPAGADLGACQRAQEPADGRTLKRAAALVADDRAKKPAADGAHHGAVLFVRPGVGVHTGGEAQSSARTPAANPE
jgi:hypothetical protein